MNVVIILSGLSKQDFLNDHDFQAANIPRDRRVDPGGHAEGREQECDGRISITKTSHLEIYSSFSNLISIDQLVSYSSYLNGISMNE